MPRPGSSRSSAARGASTTDAYTQPPMSGSDARDEPTAAEEDGAKPPSSVFMRSLKIAGLLFAIAVGGIALTGYGYRRKRQLA